LKTQALCKNCRIVRLCLTGLLIATSAVAGYHWGTIIETGVPADSFDYLVGAFALVVVVLVIVTMDATSARIEEKASLDAEELQRLAHLAESDRANGENMERALAELTEDNARLRDMLRARDNHAPGASRHPHPG